MIRIHLSKSWRVRLLLSTQLPMSAADAWSHTRDFARFTTLDPLHGRMLVAAGQPRAGARLTIRHGWLGVRIPRVGRILRWQEGRGYSFSDLSQRGPRAAFPHVYTYTLRPQGSHACRLEVEVAGLWTAAFLPRPIVQAWLWWVMARTKLMLENHLLRAELKARRKATDKNLKPQTNTDEQR